MSKISAVLLLAFLMVLTSAVAEERFPWEIEPLRVKERGGEEGYLVSLSNKGIRRARILTSSQSGLRVFPAQERSGAFQAEVYVPFSLPTRLVIQVETNEGHLRRSETLAMNAPSQLQDHLRSEVEILARKLQVNSRKIRRQEQLTQLLPDSQQGLLREGVSKRLSAETQSKSEEIKNSIDDLEKYFLQLRSELERMQNRSDTRSRATNLFATLEGYQSLFEAIRND